jgi:hypothetical protein
MSENLTPNTSVPEIEQDYSFRESFSKRIQDLAYLWKFRFRFLILVLLAIPLGVAAAYFSTATYTARLTFVVEESKEGGGSIVSALAGQFGFDLGGMGTSGILAGDNVQQLLVSSKIIKKTLLTPFPDEASKSLADKYAEVYKLKKKWGKYFPVGKTVSFGVGEKKRSRLDDSLLQTIMKQITESEVGVSKPDKKLSFFEASATMRDEKLASLFCSRLIKEATEFYTQTKTSKLRKNIRNLQSRADSIARILNKKTYSASAANQILLDVNPTANVSAELQGRDKMVLSTIYAEIIKNLEVNKTMLMQETPTFQIVDEPEYPLKKNKLKYPKAIVISIAISAALYALYLLIKRK